MDVCEQFRDGWASLHRPDLQRAWRKRAEEVHQDGIVPIPGVQQSFKNTLVWCMRHLLLHNVYRTEVA